MAYIDSVESYDRRKVQIEWIKLRRLYYRGCPYTGDPLDTDTQGLWTELLAPTGKVPDYIENPIRALIDGTVADIYPPDSQLMFGDLEADESKALALKLLNFGPRFGKGLSGFKPWINYVLADVAQGADGLLLPRLLPEKRGLRWHYYPAEHWEEELGADSDEPDFYRIQFFFTEIGSNGKPQRIWRRYDIYKDHIVRYRDTPLFDMSDAMQHDQSELLGILPALIEYMPPPMATIEAESLGDLERELSERSMLEQLGDFPVVALRWNLLEEGNSRGEPLATLDKLIGADDDNRLLTDHMTSAIKAGGPLLGLFDADLPPGKGEEDEVDTEELAGQDIVKFNSEGDRAAHWGFPDNQPKEFPHEAARAALREALFSPSQNLAVPMADLIKAGTLSGFAYSQLNKYHNARVDLLRSRLIENGVLEQLRIGMKMARIAGLISADEEKAEPRIQYGSQPYSPDEQLKIATMLGMYKALGVPASELAALIPSRLVDLKATVAAMEEYAKKQEEMSAAVQLAKVAAPAGGSPKGVSPKMNSQRSPKDAAGVDKRNR